MVKITKEEFDATAPHYCGCPDKEIIEWQEHFRYSGIPKYLCGHNRKGKLLTQEHKDRISASEKGRVFPKEVCQKISNSLRGKKRNEEFKEKCRNRQTGKRLSEQTKQRISISNKGKPLRVVSKETCKKISDSNKGRISWNKGLTKEIDSRMAIISKKVSATLTGKPSPIKGIPLKEETKNKISCSLKGHKSWNKGTTSTEETKNKISNSLKGRKAVNKGKPMSEEQKIKISVANKGKTAWNKGLCGLNAGENHPNWQGGISYEPYCYKFNEPKKEEVRNEYDRLCLNCGKDEIQNGRKQAAHHIDYDKEQGCKGKEFNLIPLCNICNLRANFNKEHWEEHFKFLVRLWKIKDVWSWFI